MHTIKTRIADAIKEFLTHLRQFNQPINSRNHLSHIMLNLHDHFQKVINWIDVYNGQSAIRTVKLIDIAENIDSKMFKNDKIRLLEYKSKYCTFTVILHKIYGIISIETGLVQLNVIAMNYYHEKILQNELYQVDDQQNIEMSEERTNQLIKKIELFLSLYTDYKYRLCDYCLNKNIEFPEGRAFEKDYVGAFHLECDENALDKIL